MRAFQLYFIVKASKLCNLRCEYCYEYEHLSDKRRMSQGTLSNLWGWIVAYVASSGIPVNQVQVNIVWHGGEPLLLDLNYFRNAMESQSDILAGISIKNYLQTNMYRPKWDSVEELHRLGFEFSVSMDFVEGIRVTGNGSDSSRNVFNSVLGLCERKIPFGVVTVLGKHNLDSLERAYDWVASHSYGWRILPVFKGGPEYLRDYSLEPERIAECLHSIFRARSISSKYIPVDPIDDYFSYAVESLYGRKPQVSPSDKFENVLVLNVNGDIYLRPFAYNSNYCLGNVNDGPSGSLARDVYKKCLRYFIDVISTSCASCRLDGNCNKNPIYEHGSLTEHNGVDKCIYPKIISEKMLNDLSAAGITSKDVTAFAIRDLLDSHKF